jgi:hypothetical protein
MEYSMGGSNNGSGNPLGGSSSDAVPTGMLSSTVTLASQLPMAAGTITIIGILIGCCCALTISSFGRSKGRTPGSGATFPGQSNSRGSTAAKLTVCLGGGLLLWLLGGSLTLMLHWCSSSNFDPRPAIPLAASAQPPKGTFGASRVATRRRLSTCKSQLLLWPIYLHRRRHHQSQQSLSRASSTVPVRCLRASDTAFRTKAARASSPTRPSRDSHAPHTC